MFKIRGKGGLWMLAVALLLAAGTGSAWATEGAADKTLENLQAAYNGESNAHARYLAFAQKAKEEGYLDVERLFLAAAKAEEIHAREHSIVLKRMKATPVADVKTPEVKSTAENLKAALEGESYERDTMYPEFIKQAQLENNKQAQRSFKAALTAETIHAKFYTAALADLGQWKNSGKQFVVCLECGYTTDDFTLKNCPVCNNPRKKFAEFK